MEEKQEVVEQVTPEPQKSTFKKHFCTVTPFSKMLALAVSVTLPILGFLLGMEYGSQQISSTPDNYETAFTTREETASFESNESQGIYAQNSPCELNILYTPGECFCPEFGVEQSYKTEKGDILLCASTDLHVKMLDKVDYNAGLSANELTSIADIIDTATYLALYGINTTTFVKVGTDNFGNSYYKDDKAVYVLENRGDMFSFSNFYKTMAEPGNCTSTFIQGCTLERIGTCETWRMGGASYLKDKENVYVDFADDITPLSDIDPESFEYLGFVDHLRLRDDVFVQELGGVAFARDENNVYVSCGQVFEGENPESFIFEMYTDKLKAELALPE